MAVYRLTVLVVCLALVAPALAIVPEESRSREALRLEPARPSSLEQRVAPGDTTPMANAVRSFLARHGGQWTFGIDPRTSRARLVQGSGIPVVPGRGNDLGPEALSALHLPDGALTVLALEPVIRKFIENQKDLLEPGVGQLVLNRDTSLERLDGRLMSFNFDWVVDGIPVEEAGVFVRLNSGNITQFGAPFVGPIQLDTTPTLAADEAVRRLLEYTGDTEVAQLRGNPTLVIQLEDGPGGGIVHRLVFKVVYRIAGEIETWEGRLDAHTGAVVLFRDTNHYARAVGGIYPRTITDDEVSAPMPYATVLPEGAAISANSAGAYGYSGGTVSSGLNGLYFDTSCQSCSNPPQPLVQQSLGSGRLNFGSGGTDEVGNGFASPADRNAFYHMNQVRDFALKWLPGSTFLADTNFTANVNIIDTCNAVFTGDAVNFYRSGGGCNNTGEISDVMYHEYGHGIDLSTNGGDGATGEATADNVAFHLTHSSLIGPFFRTNGDPVRDLNWMTSDHPLLTLSNVGSNCSQTGSTGPLGYEVHCEGEIYGQTAWDLSQALVAKHGLHTGWRTAERVFFGSLPDAQGYLPNDSQPCYDAYINADDDDGNLANGTPNAQEIFAAFDAHEIANAQVPTSAGCLRPAQPALTVDPQCDRLDLDWNAVPGIDHYEVFRTPYLADRGYFPVAEVPAGQTSYSDTEVAPGVPYWYTVMAVSASGCESKVENPVGGSLISQPILSVTGAVTDDEPRGNRSGFADPGEEVDLGVTLANFGEVTATGLSGSLVSPTAGVTVLFASASWPDLPSGGAAASQGVLRFETDDQLLACGDVLTFQLVPTGASGCASDTSFFNVTLGEKVAEVHHDFEADLGWGPDLGSSTATTGQWVRGDPTPTQYQPDLDVTASGTDCWYTAPNSPGNAGADDVDNGVVVLLSPVLDLSSLESAEVSYHRWYALSEPGTDPGDFFKAEVSDNGGGSWVELETLDNTEPAPAWTERRFRLEDFIQFTSAVRFRFQAADGLLDGSIVEAAIDELRIDRLICDDTPACFVEPSFAGLASAGAGDSCGEIELGWQAATSNCVDAEITYNVYRSTVSGFVPGPANLAYGGLTVTSLADIGLDPGETYYYVVRAFDSRSGEDSNADEQSAVAPVTPDLSAPAFAGLEVASTGARCGETVLGWQAALESCNGPAAYDIHRSPNPGFTPGPANRIATTFSTAFVDTSVTPGTPHTYLVRARDTIGNADTNNAKITVDPGAEDQVFANLTFEPSNAGWAATAPNDASAGNWAWGNPTGTNYQPENDVTPGSGVRCWITGLSNQPSNGDVDGGTTTLLSAQYNMAGAVNPRVAYSRWFTNDQGGSPGDATDTFLIEVSNNNGIGWTPLEVVGAGTPLLWLPQEFDLPVAPTNQMLFRFTARDLGQGSIVEAGIDEFSLVDVGGGCNDCAFAPPDDICVIEANRVGNDVVLDWSQNPVPGYRAVIYAVSGCGARIKIGSSDGNTFVHENAILSPERFNYRVTFVDSCGTEQEFCGTTSCP